MICRKMHLCKQCVLPAFLNDIVFHNNCGTWSTKQPFSMSGLPPPNHPGFQNDIPFPPTWSEVHPESAHLFWRCCEAGQWRQDECGSSSFLKASSLVGCLSSYPVHIGQTPEKSYSPCHWPFSGCFHCICPGGTVILFHWLSRGLLVQGFQVIQFLFKGFLGGDFRHIRMVEGMVSTLWPSATIRFTRSGLVCK